MVQWFLDDDAGYLAWLVANPRGFVLNTWPDPKPGYLVLHRSHCRTINRELREGSRWTRPYAKACAGTDEELIAWALAKANGEPKVCLRCGGRLASDATKTRRHPSRAPVVTDWMPDFVGEPIRIRVKRRHGGPDLVIDGAQWLAEAFFRLDASSVGTLSYDAATLTTRPDRFEAVDVTTLNRTMAARTATKHWERLFGEKGSAILAALDPAWDLVAQPDADASAVLPATVKAISAMEGPHRRLAVVTKMLHLKRPALVPVLDSLVVEQLGARRESTDAILRHAHLVGRENIDGLRAIQAHLAGATGADGKPIERTLVRILDGLLWTTHPGAVLYPRLVWWQEGLTPRAKA